MTRFAAEQVPAQLLREGKIVYDVTLDLIISGSLRTPHSGHPQYRENGLSARYHCREWLLRFAFHFRRQTNGRYRVCKRDSAYAPRVIVELPIEQESIRGVARASVHSSGTPRNNPSPNSTR